MKYHVYGIGNALVDKEFEVTDEFLAAQNIEKGMMSLIDQEQQETLLNQLRESFGLKKRAGGGSAANTIVAVSQLGGNTFYACKVADDETGNFYMHDLHEAGVTTRLDQVKGDGVTGKCMVMVTPDAERTMNTFLGITADFSEDELHLEDLKDSQYLYIEGYLVTSDVSRAAALKAREVAKENGVKTALTFSDPAIVTYFHEGMTEVLGEGADVLFCNEEEAMTFTKADNEEDAIKQLSQLANTLVVTQGSKGALIISGDEKIQIAANPTTAIDTNGAGDMFAGAFMYGITNGHSLEEAGKLASKAASEIVSRFGARLDKETYQQLSA